MSLTESEFDRIRDIANKANGPLGTELAKIKERIDNHLQRIEEHHRTLYGNGKPGVVEEVRSLRERAADDRWIRRTVTGAIIMVVIPAMGIGVVWLIVHVMR